MKGYIKINKNVWNIVQGRKCLSYVYKSFTEMKRQEIKKGNLKFENIFSIENMEDREYNTIFTILLYKTIFIFLH